MKVTVYTVDGSITMESVPDESILGLVEDWQTGDSATISLALDGTRMAYVARAHISCIEVGEEVEASDPRDLERDAVINFLYTKGRKLLDASKADPTSETSPLHYSAGIALNMCADNIFNEEHLEQSA